MTAKGTRTRYTPGFLSEVHAALLRARGNQTHAARALGLSPWVVGRAVRVLVLDQGVLVKRTGDAPSQPTVATDWGECLRVLSQYGGSAKLAAAAMGVSSETMRRRVREMRSLGWEVPTTGIGRPRAAVLTSDDVRAALLREHGHVGRSAKRLRVSKRVLQDWLAAHPGMGTELRDQWDLSLVHTNVAKGWALGGPGPSRPRRTQAQLREARREDAEDRVTEAHRRKAEAQRRYRARSMGRQLGLRGGELETYARVVADRGSLVVPIPGGLRLHPKRGGGRKDPGPPGLADILWEAGRRVRRMTEGDLHPEGPGVTGVRCLPGGGSGERGLPPTGDRGPTGFESPPGGQVVGAIDRGLGPTRVGAPIAAVRRTNRWAR